MGGKIPKRGYCGLRPNSSSLQKNDMSKFVWCLLAMFLIGPLGAEAQKKAKSKKKTVVRKATVKKAPEALPAENANTMLEFENGKSLYMGNTGDKLVYEVTAGGKTYDFIVTLGASDEKYRYVFDWEMTAPVNRSGHVNITKEAAYDSKRYNNFFSGGNLTLTEACTVWLTGSNFAEVADKKVSMQLDNDSPETFLRKDDAETEYTVTIKGKEVKLDIFKLDNDKLDTESRQLWIQGISSFPLIVKMDLGWKIRLKEIR
jgi:hypothetical protein